MITLLLFIIPTIYAQSSSPTVFVPGATTAPSPPTMPPIMLPDAGKFKMNIGT